MTRFHLLSSLTIALCVLLGAPAGLAQDLSADEILANLEQSARTLEDASFLATGKLIDVDGTSYDLEIEVDVIPGLELLRAYFILPDALADNFVIIDSHDVYNYLFLTNQVTILDINDPDALGGLLPETEVDLEEEAERLDLTFDLEALFQGWTMSVQGYRERPEGNVYVLRFDNEEEGAEIGRVNAEVFDQEWYPRWMEFVLADGHVIAEIFIENFARELGLDPADLRYIPPDAEIIDER